MQDFNSLIRHVDFAQVLFLADRLKREQGGANLDVFPAVSTNSFDIAAELLRTTLMYSDGSGEVGFVGVMVRGECPITDSLIDETLNTLVCELKLCLESKQHRVLAPSSSEGQAGTSGRRIGKKLSKWQTDLMIEWMITHREHPFPTQSEIHELANATNLSSSQVVNWTTNVRKRNLKGTVENRKKPHHFLDYLFLATEREKQLWRTYPELDFSQSDGTGIIRPRAPTLTTTSENLPSKQNSPTKSIPNKRRTKKHKETEPIDRGNEDNHQNKTFEDVVGNAVSLESISFSSYENLWEEPLFDRMYFNKDDELEIREKEFSFVV